MYLGDNDLIVNYLGKKYLLIKETIIGDYSKIRQLLKNNKIDTIVFDNAIISNKKIIQHFEALKNEKVAFKIHPKGTNFLIGSTSPNIRVKLKLLSKCNAFNEVHSCENR